MNMKKFLLLILPVLLIPFFMDGKSLPYGLRGGEDGIIIGKDTVTYLCSSFMQPNYVTLGDLLEAVPGMEVGDDCSLLVHGQSVKRLYIEGTGIFFYDVPVVVRNFPASIVEKILVYDYIVATESLLDVPYMKIPQKRVNLIIKEEELGRLDAIIRVALGGKLHDGKRFLYDGGVAAVSYNREKQSNFAFYADAYNNREVDRMYLQQGYSAGATGFSPVMKYSILNVAATYKHLEADWDASSSRTTFYENSDVLNTGTEVAGADKTDLFEFTALLSNILPGNFQYEISEVILADKTLAEEKKMEELSVTGGKSDISRMQEMDNGRNFTSSTGLYAVYRSSRDSRRAFVFNLAYNIGRGKEEVVENSLLYGDGNSVTEEIAYRNTNKKRISGYDAYFSYSEPISDNWRFNARIESSLANTKIDGEVQEVEGGGYTTYSFNHFLQNNTKAMFQYKTQNTILQMGGAMQAIMNEQESRNGNTTAFSGKDELIRDWSPFLNFEYTGKRGRELLIKYTGISSHLGDHLLSTVPDISNPSLVNIGNIYLQPGFNNSFLLQYRFNSSRNKNLMYFTFTADRKRRGVVQAGWFDKAGMQYTVPVNSRKVTRNMELTGNFSNIPLNGSGTLSFNTVFKGSRGVMYGYQAIGESDIIDLQNFNYAKFIEKFWGSSPDGSEFYNGKTGFRESKTKVVAIEWDANIDITTGPVSTTLGAAALRNIVKYSLNPKADANTWDFGVYADVEIQWGKGWNSSNTLRYNMYDGYAPGYGKSVLNWEVEVYKSVGACTFSLRGDDLLNQSVRVRRITGANYFEDTRYNVLGRRVLLGCTIRF